MSKLIQILKDINELIVFKHSIFALPFIFVAMIVASKSLNNSIWFGWELLILGILCAVSARNFAMGANRYLDRDIDKDIEDIARSVFESLRPEVFSDKNLVMTEEYLMKYIQKRTFVAVFTYVDKNVTAKLNTITQA